VLQVWRLRASCQRVSRLRAQVPVVRVAADASQPHDVRAACAPPRAKRKPPISEPTAEVMQEGSTVEHPAMDSREEAMEVIE
jgi:hypothetical protein